jgi:hypothetical protein
MNLSALITRERRRGELTVEGRGRRKHEEINRSLGTRQD